MFKSRAYWKLTLIAFVSVLVFMTIVIDFNDPPYPEWSLLKEGDPLPPANVNGAKAAILALAGAVTLFIGLIPTGNSSSSNAIDLMVKLIGAASAGAAGWFWLLSATEGRPGPYLLVMVPTMGLMVFLMVFNGVGRYATIHDEKQIREEGYAKLNWAILAMALGALAVGALIVGAIVYLPGMLF